MSFLSSKCATSAFICVQTVGAVKRQQQGSRDKFTTSLAVRSIYSETCCVWERSCDCYLQLWRWNRHWQDGTAFASHGYRLSMIWRGNFPEAESDGETCCSVHPVDADVLMRTTCCQNIAQPSTESAKKIVLATSCQPYAGDCSGSECQRLRYARPGGCATCTFLGAAGDTS